ncbi:DUF2911 domain-containing protein [Pyxidicoccus fallax]|uniref:DUF2911 domain-containing protein n=2 Tax=Pyxidicoccus fallax TaxID=394095 RepID=A0A848L5P4_9BACT|nr:DUF2911 domain-containing protein [Pyxidicoccus fallax]NPC76996.1 DUF2911 domain-containing protein [Pyxidicoccus fallax]
MSRLSIPTVAALVLLAAAPALAQKSIPPEKTPASPLQMAAKKLNDTTYVKVTYSSPRIQDPKTGEKRAIFGKLVPYGEVWRLGANAATELTATADIELAGKRLPAGTYSLFTIPQADKWTLIVSKDVGQWGAYKYNKDNDVLRVDVPAKKSADTYEALTIAFDDKGTALNFSWENTQVSVPVRPASGAAATPAPAPAKKG